VAIIVRRLARDCDVDYLFGQVNLHEPMIDYSQIAATSHLRSVRFAIDEGFVDPGRTNYQGANSSGQYQTGHHRRSPGKRGKAEWREASLSMVVREPEQRSFWIGPTVLGRLRVNYSPPGNLKDVLKVKGEGSLKFLWWMQAWRLYSFEPRIWG